MASNATAGIREFVSHVLNTMKRFAIYCGLGALVAIIIAARIFLTAPPLRDHKAGLQTAEIAPTSNSAIEVTRDQAAELDARPDLPRWRPTQAEVKKAWNTDV